MQSRFQEPDSSYWDIVERALAAGIISDEQETNLYTTDIVFNALQKPDSIRVWVAVEASNILKEGAVEKARASADALNAVFGERTEAVVAGYRIRDLDMERAERLGVHAFMLPVPRPPSETQ